MGEKLSFIQSLHRSTKRDYLARMNKEKAEVISVAKRFDKAFFDGDRKYGYGGFSYDGRWQPLSKKLTARYALNNHSALLDIGCAKGYLIRDFQTLLDSPLIKGFDISAYAIKCGTDEGIANLRVHDAKNKYPYADKTFDLAVSINVLHNLFLPQLIFSLSEMERVAKAGYLVVESYRNEREKCNLFCWNLTGECFFTPDEWLWIFQTAGYTGDYEFIFFE